MAMPPILANVITADMGFLPGLALFGPAFGMPLSLLAGLLERPFLTCAGIQRWALWFSLQANLVSLLIGYLLLPLAMMALGIVGPFWFPCSVFLSIVIERAYLKWKAGPAGFDGRWRWICWANIFSAFALTGILLLAAPLNIPDIKTTLMPYRAILMGIGIGVSLLAFIVAFAIPAIGMRQWRRTMGLRSRSLLPGVVPPTRRSKTDASL